MNLQNKGVIRTSTLRRMVEEYRGVDISDKNEIREYLMSAGLGQVIQKRLQERDYRSVKEGLFVNLEKCDNLHFLKQLFENEDLLIKDKEKVQRRIESIIKKHTDQQGYFDLSSPDLYVKFNITEEELIAELEANAI